MIRLYLRLKRRSLTSPLSVECLAHLFGHDGGADGDDEVHPLAIPHRAAPLGVGVEDAAQFGGRTAATMALEHGGESFANDVVDGEFPTSNGKAI
jgi:hypothetical protein